MGDSQGKRERGVGSTDVSSAANVASSARGLGSAKRECLVWRTNKLLVLGCFAASKGGKHGDVWTSKQGNLG